MTRQILAIAATACILVFPALDPAARTSGAKLSFNVTNIKNDKGKLVVAIFDSKENFLKKPVSEVFLEIGEDGEANGGFSDLLPGTYAIAAYHDKNDDGKLNTVIVVPREDYGFSNNARNMFGPPGFKEAAFEMGAEDMEIAFRVR